MDEQYLKSWLRLLLTEGMSNECAHALLKHVGLPEDIFEASVSALISHVGEPLAFRLRAQPTERVEKQIESLLRWLRETPSARLVTLDDKNYPSSFLMSGVAPLAFFAVGNLSLLSKKTVSLVGSNHPNEQGIELATQWATKLCENSSLSIVQTDKEGIELHALRAVARANPNALIWIPSTALIQEQLCKKINFVASQGLVLIAVPPVMPESEELEEQAIQSLVLATVNAFVVIQAELRSSTMTLMREAGDCGRDVMAVPGSIHSPLSKGSHQLIKQGAVLVEGTDDVLKTLNLKKL